MAGVPKAIEVEPNTELARLLETVDDEAILLDHGGGRFRLIRESAAAPLPKTDPDFVSRTLDETVGSWADLDAERLIAELYEARAKGSRAPDELS